MVSQLVISFAMFWTFSEVYLPKCTTIASLVNLPIKKAGMMYNGFIRAIPPAKKEVLLAMVIKNTEEWLLGFSTLFLSFFRQEIEHLHSLTL